MKNKNNIYKIVDDFQVTGTDIRVLVLDRKFNSFEKGARELAIIDGNEYEYTLNSVRNWITIKSKDNFAEKSIEFI